MPSTTMLQYLLSALLFNAQVFSAPASTSHPLAKRAEQLAGCNADQTKKVETALKDAAEMANLAHGFATKDKYGFKHYFRDEDFDAFKGGMSAIASNNDPTNPPYKFIINCKPTGKQLELCGDVNKKEGSYAFTDPAVPKDDKDLKSLWLCPKFFDAAKGPDAKNLLPPAGSDKDEDKKATKAFCDQKDFKQFATAGQIVLHEMTHLDAVAKQWLPAPDPKNPNGPHGTEDFELGSSPMEAARTLKKRFENDPKRTDVIKPPRNAESYAAAATELWVENICNKKFVAPK